VIEEEARRILGRALEEASAMLTRQSAELDRLIAALLEHETLEREELATILGTAVGVISAHAKAT
jgi:ATP-dependent Zn protease